MTIEEICKLARAEGLSYGQYVLRHADQLRQPPPPAALRPGERRCLHCGRIFAPVNIRNRFCRASCRVAWNTARRRALLRKERHGG